MSKRIYADHTRVPVIRSQVELRELLRKFGATRFGMAEADEEGTVIGFSFNSRTYRFVMPITFDSERAERAHWRRLILVVKAKLVAIETGVSSFEEEFLANTVTPSGRTVFEETRPAIEQMYRDGRSMPLLLEGPQS
jgi:hypothetical protein